MKYCNYMVIYIFFFSLAVTGTASPSRTWSRSQIQILSHCQKTWGS